jgi:WD40 repeat protein
LVILVLLVGSGTGLYLGRKPWVGAFTLNSETYSEFDISSDSEWIAVSNARGLIRILRLSTGTELMSLAGHTTSVQMLRFSKDCLLLYSAGNDGRLIVWDLRTQKMLWSENIDFYTVDFSHDSTRLVVGRRDSDDVQIRNAHTGAIMTTLVGHTRSIYGFAFTPDMAQIATVGQDSVLRFWDAATGRELWNAKHDTWIVATTISRDGSKILTATNYGQMLLWDVATRKNLAVCDARFQLHREFDYAFSTDTQAVIIVDDHGNVSVRDVGTWRLAWQSEEPRCGLAAISQDGRRVATAENALIAIREAGTGLLLDAVAFAGNNETSLILTKNGDYLFAEGNHIKQIWHRRRPEYWWGVAWLPEFWLTALFAGALVWSVWRDRKSNFAKRA